VRELLAGVLTQHLERRRMARELRLACEREDASSEALAAPARLLHDRIRLEERRLFPAIEELVPEAELDALAVPERDRPPAREDTPVVDLRAGLRDGPLWGAASEDLNATLLRWPPGGGIPEHVNDERDVLLVALRGSGTVAIDGDAHGLAGGTAVLVEKGRRRRVVAGPKGLRLLSVHLRRVGLQVSPRLSRPPDAGP
jgi:quercetin dioxygenase-like cupin family protein